METSTRRWSEALEVHTLLLMRLLHYTASSCLLTYCLLSTPISAVQRLRSTVLGERVGQDRLQELVHHPHYIPGSIHAHLQVFGQLQGEGGGDNHDDCDILHNHDDLYRLTNIPYPHFPTTSLDIQLAFAVNTCMLFFALAGNFALFPPVIYGLFGPKAGTVIYGMLYSAFATASVVGGIVTKLMVKSVGWAMVFQTLAFMSIVATLLVQALTSIASYSGSVL